MTLTVHERYAIAMKHAKKFAGKSAARPILAGVYHAPDGSLAVTDAHRLLRVENAHERTEPIVLDAKTNALIDGMFPDISRVIPTSFCAEYTVGGETLDTLILAHEIAVKVGGKKTPYAAITVVCGGPTVKTTCGTGVYEYAPTVRIDRSGDDFTVHYNAQYVLDALVALRDFRPQTVSIRFTGALSPFVLESDNGVLTLILPIKRPEVTE
ncbi:hypothetical protein A6764_15180 [Brevibacillus sp. WF146]|uniref:hypothetical protein n=1 Tax=Brevibacillus sp. WF146 TaxID=319501 RepID=UPI0007EC9074|nr:hypothetical protein [Brevibacillus sp. WF146]UYZ12167.1 hypothetical protein A6764_15180 [Brevibacillus sp. WF146]